MLTGKAKEDFKSWLAEESEKYHQHEWLDNDMYLDEIWLPPPIENCLILEWLDSVGIYIEVGAICIDGHAQYDYNIQENNTLNGMNGITFNTRQGATKSAIEYANKIYNER